MKTFAPLVGSSLALLFNQVLASQGNSYATCREKWLQGKMKCNEAQNQEECGNLGNDTCEWKEWKKSWCANTTQLKPEKCFTAKDEEECGSLYDDCVWKVYKKKSFCVPDASRNSLRKCYSAKVEETCQKLGDSCVWKESENSLCDSTIQRPKVCCASDKTSCENLQAPCEWMEKPSGFECVLKKLRPMGCNLATNEADCQVLDDSCEWKTRRKRSWCARKRVNSNL
uniref:Uncharacterized protein n=1 Tax=Corethron hystrix TaxID=216773 RepID=A0A7S1G1J9_9STRA